MVAHCSTRAKMESAETKTVAWEFQDWNASHELFAATQASCFVELGVPKVALRFFLKPIKKRTNIHCSNYGYSVVAKWYALYVEVLHSPQNVAIKVNAKETTSNLSADGNFALISKSQDKIFEVIEEFIHLSSGHLDTNAYKCNPTLNGALLNTKDLTITLTVTSFQLKGTSNVADRTSVYNESDQLIDAEMSLINDLKSMFSSDDNFSDLILESKDGVTLNAHKFQLAARSPYLRNMIQEVSNEEDFEGTVKLDVNSKPLMVILHWMYTGELHENAAKVIEMEEVVDVSIKFELTHLLKVLDRKFITICNKENMFRLYQVAQKNAMPTAMEDISAFIRETLIDEAVGEIQPRYSPEA